MTYIVQVSNCDHPCSHEHCLVEELETGVAQKALATFFEWTRRYHRQEGYVVAFFLGEHEEPAFSNAALD